jgi:hypothetical protein
LCQLVKYYRSHCPCQYIFADANTFYWYNLLFFRKTKTKRVTRVELNKRARRKERLRTEADAKKLEVLSKQIDR